MSTWSVRRTGLFAGAVVIAVEALLLATGNNAVLRGVLLDPDCYMHLQRALRLLTEGSWHTNIDPRINAPFGYAIHWTAVFDTLLVIGAAPLTALGLDAHSALYVWGSAISPLLLIAALLVFARGVKQRIAGPVFLWLTVLIFTQPQLSGAFIVGRPDHHSLVLGLMLGQLAFAYALFDGRAHTRWAIAAGVMAGLQLATSVEALLTLFLISGGLAAAWLVYERRVLGALVRYLAAAAVTIFVWLLWEGGHYLLTPAYDRVSVTHLVALASGALAIMVLALADRRGTLSSPRRKAFALGGAIGFTAIVMLAAYPDFFGGPWPHLDPVIIAWHAQVGELQPLWPHDGFSLASFFAQMTAPLLALPLVFYRLVRGPATDRPMMLLSLVGFLLFGGLTMCQMRWAGEVQAVMLLPWTLTTIAIMKSEIRLGPVPLRTFALGGALLLQVLPTMATQSTKGLESFTTHPGESCDWSGAARAIGENLPDQAIVMAPIWAGPELLWRSKVRILAGPYEMLPALKDTAAFLHGGEVEAHTVVGRRGVSHALICRFDNWPGFGGELAVGRHPDWLKPVPFKDGPKGFMLYRVTP